MRCTRRSVLRRLTPVAADPKREHAGRVEAGVEAPQLVQAAHQQTGAGEERHRQSHLDADEQPLQRVARRRVRPARASCGEQPVTRGAQRGQQAAQECDEDGDREREEQHLSIDDDLVHARQIDLQRSHRRRPRGRGQKSDDSAGERQQQRLDQHLHGDGGA